MPRRNLTLVLAVGFVSLICYEKAQHNRFARIVADVMNKVEANYLEEIEPQDLFEGAVAGIIDRLGDPNSTYIPPAKKQEFDETIDKEFVGVGMEVGMDAKTQQLTVLSPLVGTPAYKAGILAGDVILQIGDKSTQGLSLKDAVGLMRGESGTTVELVVSRKGSPDPITVEIVRAKIQVDTVLGDVRDADGAWHLSLEDHPQIGYLRIVAFSQETPDELLRALKRLTKHGMRALIVDLRDDPGGRLDAAIEVSDLFVDSGVIVSTRDRREKTIDQYDAHAEGTFSGFPVAVLVNQNSASASEIVAACLQDHKRAIVVGQRSYGKGTVQKVFELEDNLGALKLTTAKYCRPNGKNIHRRRNPDDGEEEEWGVKPNKGYEVVLDEDELIRRSQWRRRRDRPADNGEPAEDDAEPFVDRQLEKALEYVQAEVAKKNNAKKDNAKKKG
ncbi:MAG: S41 family peptidase [Candidatus Nealsonbacteria bacterium]|nr:S41 family peptidase [Candidatus Nealsonbacteria bacterium]